MNNKHYLADASKNYVEKVTEKNRYSMHMWSAWQNAEATSCFAECVVVGVTINGIEKLIMHEFNVLNNHRQSCSSFEYTYMHSVSRDQQVPTLKQWRWEEEGRWQGGQPLMQHFAGATFERQTFRILALALQHVLISLYLFLSF